MKPKFITFTGLDAQTDMERVAALSQHWPCEWGILFSRNRQGLDNRYPARDVIDHHLTFPVNFAAHLCGKYAQDVMDGRFDDVRDAVPLESFHRVQVNHTAPDVARLRAFGDDFTVIGQWRDEDHFPHDDDGVSWLYDPSGGNGLAPTAWPVNRSPRIVGYAGGINPTNAARVADTVGELSGQGYWLDMETGIRQNDWLDLDLVEEVLREVYG